MDGATPLQVGRFIIFPILRPTTLFFTIVLTVGAFQAFIHFYIMTQGGPNNQTQVLLSYVYQQAFKLPGTRLRLEPLLSACGMVVVRSASCSSVSSKGSL